MQRVRQAVLYPTRDALPMLRVIKPPGTVGDKAPGAHLRQTIGQRIDVAVDAVDGRNLARHPVAGDFTLAGDKTKNRQRQLGMGLRREGGGAVPRSAFDMIEDNASASIGDLVSAMESVQAVHVSEVIVKHCVDLVRRTRESKLLDFGCSPRAGLALINASRARAVIHGRDFVTPEDLFDLAEDVVLHRIRVSYEASAAGHTAPKVLQEILAGLGVPDPYAERPVKR